MELDRNFTTQNERAAYDILDNFGDVFLQENYLIPETGYNVKSSSANLKTLDTAMGLIAGDDNELSMSVDENGHTTYAFDDSASTEALETELVIRCFDRDGDRVYRISVADSEIYITTDVSGTKVKNVIGDFHVFA